jgi:hypothetical protein
LRSRFLTKRSATSSEHALATKTTTRSHLHTHVHTRLHPRLSNSMQQPRPARPLHCTPARAPHGGRPEQRAHGRWLAGKRGIIGALTPAAAS